MSWKNIKTFMIVLLLIACTVIGAMLLLGGDNERYTEDSLEKSVALMEKSGIIIDSELLKGTLGGMKVYRFTLPQDYPEKVAEIVTAGNVTDVFTVPDGFDVRTDGGESLFVGNDFSISYKCSDTEISISDTEIEKLLLPECESPDFGVRREMTETSGNAEIITFVQTLGSMPIPENEIKCKFTDGNLTEFSGKWCFPDKCGTFSAQLRDYLNIMFTERERVDSADGEKRQLTVKDLEKCYSIENSEGKSVFILVPSLHIIYKEGESAVHSAVAN